MTIITTNSYCTSGIRLTFGVPLEDVFPYGDIHPSLKNLFVEIFNALSYSDQPIKNHLKYEAPVPDYIHLKEVLTLCQPIDYMSAGTLMWMLRHFLTSLPIPLLPKYTDGKHFVWLKLSNRCKHAFLKYLNDKRSNEFLIDTLTEELLKLPSVHLLLIGYLVNFLRSLIISGKMQRVNKNSAQVLVNYFSPSLFVRPHHNGTQANKCGTQYHPLMLYLIVKWPQIQQNCMLKHPQCFVPIGQRCQRQNDVIYENNSTQTVTATNSAHQETNSTQTWVKTVLEPIDEDSLEFKSTSECQTHTSADSFFSIPESAEYYVDTSCQTEDAIVQIPIAPIGVVTNVAQTQTDPELSKLAKLVRTGKRMVATISTQTSEPDSPKNSENSYRSFDDFLYDDYDVLYKTDGKAENKLDVLKNSYKISEKENETKHKHDLLERTSKIGFTYTPKADSSAGDVLPNNIESSTPKEFYKIAYDEDANSIPNIPSSSNINNPEFAETNNAATPLSSTKSKTKSLVNFGKIKFDIKKIFKARKITGSTSADHISNVKYEKISTTRSNLF